MLLYLDCRIIDNHLVESGEHMTTREVLYLLARLHEQTAVRDGHADLLALPRPQIQTGKSRLAVDGEEVQVVVKACENGVTSAKLVQV